jgi:RimJ/RimL family protein N-acetyltransferase
MLVSALWFQVISAASWRSPFTQEQRSMPDGDDQSVFAPFEQVLNNGARITIRPIAPTDAPALQVLFSRLSARSIYQRYFHQQPSLSIEQARFFAEVDRVNRVALVALDPDDPSAIIAVVRFDLDIDDTAEYAAVVVDQWQGQGIGLAMTRRLVEIARAQGLRALYALVLPGNRLMLELFKHLGLPEEQHYEDGFERVDILLTPADNDVIAEELTP